MDRKSITIAHYNDAYQIEERGREPVGGAARYFSLDVFSSIVLYVGRFVGGLKQLNNPLVICSGDLWSPSVSMHL